MQSRLPFLRHQAFYRSTLALRNHRSWQGPVLPAGYMIEKRLKEASRAQKGHRLQLDMGLPVLRVLQHPGEK